VARVATSGSRAVRRAVAFGSQEGHRRREPLHREHGVPAPVRAAGVALQGALDEVVLGGFQAFVPRTGARRWRAIEQETDDALAFFGQRGWLDAPATYHHTPPSPTDARVRPLRVLGRDHESLTFTSGWVPEEGEPGRDRWLGHVANHRVRVLLLRHPGPPRPWLVCVHGAQMGRAPLDLRFFRAEQLHRELGVNVALPVLPLYGPRRDPRAASSGFLGLDQVESVHGLAQALWDIRRLLVWLRSDQRAPTVGLYGFSLGGYLTALTAAFEPDLAVALAGAPATDFSTLLRRNAPREQRDQPRFRALVDRGERLLRVVSPLTFPPAVPHDRLVILAGTADRMAHPIDQVNRLVRHWGDPETRWVHGGHLGLGGSTEAADFVRDALRRRGVVG
jgi:hypothetical protein